MYGDRFAVLCMSDKLDRSYIVGFLLLAHSLSVKLSPHAGLGLVAPPGGRIVSLRTETYHQVSYRA